jgi:tetratricopeptide (TPR) repeat protein
MATVTDKPYTVAGPDEIEWGPAVAPGAQDSGRTRQAVRSALGITSFGINAFRAPEGAEVIREHAEAGLGSSRQEELYLVLWGTATFDVDGDSFDAPTGTLVYARPEAKRSAVAKDGEATIIVIGGTPGEAFVPPSPEAVEAFAAYNEGDYETAVAKQLVVVEQRPDNVLVLFNAACFEARAGRTDEAIEHLQRAVAADERVKENIRTDEDLDSIREDPRFDVLTK